MNKIIIFGFVVLFIFLVSCASVVDPKKSCSLDSDCFPDACCHPAGAVNKENAPNCKGMLCTMECVPETLDCGQGEIRCLDEECRSYFIPDH